MTIEDARALRRIRAKLLQQVEQGELSVRRVLRRPIHALGGCDIWDLLLRCPSMGRVGARRVCEESKIFPHTRIEELTRQERAALLRALPERIE